MMKPATLGTSKQQEKIESLNSPVLDFKNYWSIQEPCMCKTLALLHPMFYFFFYTWKFLKFPWYTHRQPVTSTTDYCKRSTTFSKLNIPWIAIFLVWVCYSNQMFLFDDCNVQSPSSLPVNWGWSKGIPCHSYRELVKCMSGYVKAEVSTRLTWTIEDVTWCDRA